MSERYKKAIVWFRNDLRIHDNEALVNALSISDEVHCVYVFDERIFGGKTHFGFEKCGRYRAQFILESVIDLRDSLRRMGGDLIVRYGHSEEEIFALAKSLKSSWVFCNRERTAEEVKMQDGLEEKLWSIGQEIVYSRGKMLYYTADLPFPITQTPETFTTFRKDVERMVPIRSPLAVPTSLKVPFSQVEYGEMPTLDELVGYSSFVNDAGGYRWKGGETAALDRLEYYLWEGKHIMSYKETRNQMLGGDYSSKFSPYLAHGCLSPKKIYHEVKRFEAEHGSNESTYWIVFELLWRDYFRLIGKKHGNKIFLKEGIKGIDPGASVDMEAFAKWKSAQTGVPFIDAFMKEINETGYMSNRGRQIVASYLVNDLGFLWLLGAEYFESLLIDYDPCSNYGNWMYVAGVGNDPRENRYFDINVQTQKYDPQCVHIKYWLPEYQDVEAEHIRVLNQKAVEE